MNVCKVLRDIQNFVSTLCIVRCTECVTVIVSLKYDCQLSFVCLCLICMRMVQLMWLYPKTPSSLASFKSRHVLPFWYRLIQVVLVKRPLNWCSSSGSNSFDCINTTTHTHPFNGPFSGTTQASRYQKGKTNLDFTEARDSEWQWHQLGHMQVCTSLQPALHHSVFYRPDALPAAQPTASKHWRLKALKADLY